MKRSAKKLFLDIEVSPNIGLFWQPGNKISIPYENIIKERAIICVCWKWAGSREVCDLRWDKRQNDKKLLKEFSKEWDKADVVIGHNGDKFDIKWLKGRVIHHGLPPLSPMPTIDTLKLARQNFYFNSNRLDYLGQFLGLGEKLETGGMKLWRDILLKDCPVSMDKMVKYCKQDVNLLEQVYNHLTIHCPPKIRIDLSNKEQAVCPHCASTSTKLWGTYHTLAGQYQRYRCNVCLSTWKGNKQLKIT